jgi:hypothetical protein
VVCGKSTSRRRRYKKAPHRICAKSEAVTVAAESLAEVTGDSRITSDIATYGHAVLRWLAAGRPVRSPEEVAAIFRDHCLGCEFYNAQSGRCKICGCRVKREGHAVLNKIAMATEHCPKRYW